VLPTEYCSCDQIKKNEKGGAYSTYGKRRGAHRFLWGNLRERDNVEDLDFYERIILKWFFKKRDGEAQTVLIGPSIATGGGFFVIAVINP
jgi:hypothetical protein